MQLSNAKPSLAGAAHSSASCSAKIMRGVCSRPVANVAARASAGGEGVTSSGQASARKLFQQHRVLLDSGFTYDQAALILQVSQQRTGLADPEPTSTPPLAPTTAAAASAEDDNSTSSSTNAPAANSPTSAVSASRASPAAELKTLEDRIAFLELELLKQSVVPTSTPSWASGAGADTASRSKAGTAGGFNSAAAAAAALNPAAAGAGGLSAAAAAAASRWNADSTLYRQQPRQGTTMMMAGGVAGGIQDPSAAASDAVVISTQLAAAAELGQLDPDVYALAEALAVRQGFAAMQPAAIPQQPGLFGGGSFGGYLSPQQQMMQMQMQQQPQPPHQHGVRRPASIWGRSVHHSRPLSANTWGGVGQQYPLYDPTSNTTNMGEPLLSQRDFEEDVPYNPSGWAIAGTIVTVYLGVIVTFLAMCVGDMPY